MYRNLEVRSPPTTCLFLAAGGPVDGSFTNMLVRYHDLYHPGYKYVLTSSGQWQPTASITYNRYALMMKIPDADQCSGVTCAAGQHCVHRKKWNTSMDLVICKPKCDET